MYGIIRGDFIFFCLTRISFVPRSDHSTAIVWAVFEEYRYDFVE